jgi:Holliday junction resolvase RusA-like endonuclease
MFIVVLPVPPSVNNSYRNVEGKGRAKTKRYRDWRKNAVLAIYAQVRADRRVGGPIRVEIDLPRTCRLDIDNAIKPLLDALVDSRRIDDDRHVAELAVMRRRVEAEARVVVEAVQN